MTLITTTGVLAGEVRADVRLPASADIKMGFASVGVAGYTLRRSALMGTSPLTGDPASPATHVGERRY